MAQDIIELEGKPDLSRGRNIMEAFMDRQSIREYNSQELERPILSALLWSANGINRPDEKKRTAATASNSQEIDIYVVFPEATYFYDAFKNVLELRYKGDLRKAVASGQDFVIDAPLSIIIVGDLDKLRGNDEVKKMQLACMDAGIVSSNIYLYCAGNKLGTVARATMNTEELSKALKLNKNQRPILNHPVGYRK